MEVTEKLIEKQKTEITHVDSKYTVVVSGAGVTNYEKPKFEALLSGVRLRFLRYGLFLKKGEHRANALRIKDHKDEEFTLSDADVSNGDLNTTSRFMVGATSVREGYIYLINPKDDTDCHELKVNEDGKMSHILWGKGNFYPNNGKLKDIRLPEDDSIDYKRIINKEKDREKKRTFWIGYSPVQWTHKHFEKVMHMPEADLKALHMVFVNSGGIEKGKETAQEHVLPYNKLAFVYHKGSVIGRDFRKQLKQISYTEKKESREGENEILEDMFITLHDPIGAVEDIAFELEDSFARQEAIVEAIQNGESLDNVLQRRKNGTTKETFSEEEQQLQALYQTALTTYHLVYGDQRMERDYDGGATGYWTSDFKGSGIDKTKVEHILGVEYRKEYRAKIRALRDELGELMHTNYYKNAWQHYNTNVDDYILEGKFKSTAHMALLKREAHSVDRHLDLKKNYEADDDKWELFFNDISSLDENKPINKLLDTPIELFFITGPVIDLENKLAGVIKNLTESYAKHTIKTETTSFTKTKKEPATKVVKTTELVPGHKDVFFKRLQTIKLGDKVIIEVHTKEIEVEFKDDGTRLDNSRVDYKSYKPQEKTYAKKHSERSAGTQFRVDEHNRVLVTRMEVSKEVVLKNQLRGSNHVQLPTLTTVTKEEVVKYVKEVKETFERTTNKKIYNRTHGELAEKLFNSKFFTGSLALLQVFNVLNAAGDVSKNKNLKSVVNLVGLSAELTEASLHYYRNINNISIQTFNKSFSGRVMSYSGNIGGGITVLICAWEAFDSQSARDYDAMWAWSGAGVAWGAFLFGGTTIATGLAPLGFTPVGIIIGGIAIGLTALAYYLKDTPLEAYFKNNVLSDALPAPKDAIGAKPWAYAKALYNDRDNQTPEPSNLKFWAKDTFKKWEDMKVMYQDFLDILVCADIVFKPTDWGVKEVKYISAERISATRTISDILSYRAEISFRQFLTTKDQLEYDVYYFENKQDNAPKKLTLKKENITIDKTKGQIPKAIIDFTLYKRDLRNNNPGAHILFVCRLALEKNKYYPIGIKEKERYIGAMFNTEETTMAYKKGLFSKKIIKSSDYQSTVGIDSLANLKSKEIWKNSIGRRKVNERN